ncbi:uncharacterized protein LOC132198280 [Neocloeon triangulifer]|uniref:uncharacterized protein LOC132198280 n=1 Tax=Neocloeon triangulifer TaxID=2078957 RepID=UPI00286F9F04|nr:uncharacterized protein LOC132198280 [Neocloeon triangulifer]
MSSSRSSTQSSRRSLSEFYFYSQDRIHLVRIAVVTIMGFVTLLVVSLLLHEAVLGDQRVVNSQTKHHLIDKHKVEKAIRGMAPFNKELAKSENATSTESPTPIPPPVMRYMMRDPEYFKKMRDGYWKRRKSYMSSHKRNGDSDQMPFRLNVLSQDSYDPYVFGEDEHKAKKKKYHYPQDSKSIQDIIHFLTEGKRGRSNTHGLRFIGKVKNLDMKDPFSMFPGETRQESNIVSTNPLEDFRMAGDPKEVNNVLLGFGKSKQKTLDSLGKPKTVSLMLDIHPMGRDETSSPSRERPRRPPKRRYRGKPRPQNYHSDSNSQNRDEILHGRPSHHNEVYRPSSYRGADHDRPISDGSKPHQIMLHLNFFPSRKQGDVNLNPSKPAPLSDLAPSPRDETVLNFKGDKAFKSDPIPDILNDPNIHIFNRHRYGSATASKAKGQSVISNALLEGQSVFSNHRPGHNELKPQPHQSSHFDHPTYPLTLDDDELDEPEPRDAVLQL